MRHPEVAIQVVNYKTVDFLNQLIGSILQDADESGLRSSLRFAMKGLRGQY